MDRGNWRSCAIPVVGLLLLVVDALLPLEVAVVDVIAGSSLQRRRWQWRWRWWRWWWWWWYHCCSLLVVRAVVVHGALAVEDESIVSMAQAYLALGNSRCSMTRGTGERKTTIPNPNPPEKMNPAKPNTALVYKPNKLYNPNITPTSLPAEFLTHLRGAVTATALRHWQIFATGQEAFFA